MGTRQKGGAERNMQACAQPAWTHQDDALLEDVLPDHELVDCLQKAQRAQAAQLIEADVDHDVIDEALEQLDLRASTARVPRPMETSTMCKKPCPRQVTGPEAVLSACRAARPAAGCGPQVRLAPMLRCWGAGCHWCSIMWTMRRHAPR